MISIYIYIHWLLFSQQLTRKLEKRQTSMYSLFSQLFLCEFYVFWGCLFTQRSFILYMLQKLEYPSVKSLCVTLGFRHGQFKSLQNFFNNLVKTLYLNTLAYRKLDLFTCIIFFKILTAYYI